MSRIYPLLVQTHFSCRLTSLNLVTKFEKFLGLNEIIILTIIIFPVNLLCCKLLCQVFFFVVVELSYQLLSCIITLKSIIKKECILQNHIKCEDKFHRIKALIYVNLNSISPILSGDVIF